jgi:hypothetical protein
MKARVARLEVTLKIRFEDQAPFETGKSRGSLLSSESTKERLLAMLEIVGKQQSS